MANQNRNTGGNQTNQSFNFNFFSGNTVSWAFGLTLSLGTLGAAKLAWDNGIRVGWDDGPTIVRTPVPIEKIPPSGTISVKNINRSIKFDRLEITFKGCIKGGTKDIRCHFSVINHAGDRSFGASISKSLIIEKDRYEHRATDVEIANRGDSIELYSKIETPVIFRFPGVAPDVEKLELLEVKFWLRSGFKIQYKNVPLE